MKITTELFLMAVKNAGFEVETDGAIYMPVGCDAEESITGNLYELLDAMGIEVGAKHEQGHHPVRWVNPVALRNNYNSSLWATLESSKTQSVPLYTDPQHSGMVSAAATTGFLAGWCYRGHDGNEQAYAFGEKYARLYGEAAQELIE